MANELRVRSNFVQGTVDDNPLTNVATTLTSTELANLPAIGATQHAVIIIDPDGTPEIVYVTAHTASATTATIARGKEGTSAVEHALNTTWIHGPIVSDFSFHGVSLSHSTTQSLTNVTFTPLAFDEEVFDTDAYHDTSSNNSRITIPTGLDGYYQLAATGGIDALTSGKEIFLILRLNGATDLDGGSRVHAAGASGGRLIASTTATRHLVAGDYIEATLYHDHGSVRNTRLNAQSFSAHLLGR